jgi:CRP-like cAMP-binding protein
VSPRFVPASVAELSQIGLLAELPGQKLRELAGRMRREQVEPGKGVILEGEEGDRFYVIVSGLFAVSNQGALGPRAVLRPGAYFGEVALAMDVPRTASVTALTPSTVASCDRETFDQFVRPLFADDPAP